MTEVGVAPEEPGWWGGPGVFTYYIAFVSLLVPFIAWFVKRRSLVASLNKLPGPKCQPIVGNALEMNVDNLEMFRVMLRFCEYGELVRIWLGSHPIILISSPRAAEVLLSNQRTIEKGSEYNVLHPWLGSGLVTASGRKWHTRRKMLTPAFHFRILDDFLDVFNRQSSKMVEKLIERADGTLFNIFPYLSFCALDIICETAMRRSVNAQDSEDSEYVRALYRINEMMQQRFFQVWLHPNVMYWLLGYTKERDDCIKILHKFSQDTIRDRRRLFQDQKKSHVTTDENHLLGKKKPLAFLDLLLEACDGRSDITDEDLREEVDTFMFAGHDTTSTAISWSLYILGRHPEIQVRVHEELDSIFEDSDRPATMADLRKMNYLEMCIKETLRLFPPVPTISRNPSEDLIVDNQRIPAGVTTMLMVYQVHRDPHHFPDPEKFDPDRFLPEVASKRHPYAYIPFSAGPRNCIGQKFALLELKTVVAWVLRKFRVESDTAQSDLQLLAELVLRTKTGNFIRLYPRRD